MSWMTANNFKERRLYSWTTVDPLLGKSGTYLRILVKVARVAVVVDFGHDGRLQFAVVDVVPIEALEPTVALHVFGTVLFRKKKKK